MGFESIEIKVAGKSAQAHRGGSGDVLLFLHGNDGLSTSWSVLEKLADSFDVIAPVHPGFGGELPDWLDGIDDYAYFYLDAIEALGLGRVHAVGHSVGGWVALEMAVRNPLAFKTLTISDSSGIHVKGVPKGDPFFFSPEKLIRHLFVSEKLTEEWLDQESNMTVEEADERLMNQRALARVAWSPPFYNRSLHKWLHRINIPSHVIWGEQDRMWPMDYAREFNTRLKGSTLSVIPDCGHLALVEKPDEFVGLVTQFIRGNLG